MNHSEPESWTRIGGVAGFAGAAGMMNWPHVKSAKTLFRSHIFKYYKTLSQFVKLATTYICIESFIFSVVIETRWPTPCSRPTHGYHSPSSQPYLSREF